MILIQIKELTLSLDTLGQLETSFGDRMDF